MRRDRSESGRPEQDPPAAPNGRAEQDPPAAPNGRAEQDPPAAPNGRAEQDPPAAPNGRESVSDDAPTEIDPRVRRNRAKPPASTPAPLLPERGGTLGRFVILERLGMGGMAVVYSAFDPRLDRKVAIKLLRRDVGNRWGEEARERLVREGVALGKLNHPNVVTVYEVGESGDDIFIAQEFVSGGNLKAWLAEKRRSIKEILNVFTQAGRGLAAAHAAGLVHRDFKPANLFLGESGRVRVGDFGLARAAEAKDDEGGGRDQSVMDGIWQQPDGTLTQTGMLLGTLHYMAPEQLDGSPGTQASDQFSFCVALYEALYGERPFRIYFRDDGSICKGQLRRPLGDVSVPTWLRERLLRGLAEVPAQRYPSMEALLEELGDDPQEVRRERQAARRRKVLVLGSVALAVCGPIGAWYGIKYQAARRCAAVETQLVGVWDGATKDAIRTAFLDTRKPFAAGTWQRVERAFDTYTAEWTHMRAEVCSATWLGGTQSEEVFDLRMRCLKKRIGELGALVRIFARADATVVGKAAQASSSLTGIAICADEEALRAPYPPPKDAEARAEVAAIRETLTKVVALEKTGKYQEGLELARRLKEEGNAVGYRPVQAEALYWLGVLLYKTGEYNTAETTLYEAAHAAGEGRDGLLVAKAIIRLVWVVGYAQGRPDAGVLIGRDAEILVKLGGADDAIRSRLFNSIGSVFWRQAEYDKALTYYRKALAIREKVLGPEHHEVASSLGNMGIVLESKGHYDKALEHLSRALAIWETALGPEHPDVASTLDNMGIAFLEQGEYDKALEHHRNARAIKEKALGPEHPHVAWSLDYMGFVFHKQGEYDKALEYHRKARAVREKALGVEHPDVVWSLSGIGNAFVDQGRRKQALEPLERAAAICDKRTCELEPHGRGMFALARALVATGGDTERANRLAAEARGVFGKAPYLRKDLEEVDAWLKERGVE